MSTVSLRIATPRHARADGVPLDAQSTDVACGDEDPGGSDPARSAEACEAAGPYDGFAPTLVSWCGLGKGGGASVAYNAFGFIVGIESGMFANFKLVCSEGGAPVELDWKGHPLRAPNPSGVFTKVGGGIYPLRCTQGAPVAAYCSTKTLCR